MGRLPVMAVLEELTAADLYDILHNPNNPIITSKKRDFWAYGIDIKFEDEALRLLADQAAQEKTGARGLVSVIERVLIQFEKRLPSTDIKELVVTPEVVQPAPGGTGAAPGQPRRSRPPGALSGSGPAGSGKSSRSSSGAGNGRLKQRYQLPLTDARVDLMVDHYHHWDCDLKTAFEEMGRLYEQVRSFEDRFYAEHDIQLHFDEEAVDEILRQALEAGASAYAVCNNLSSDLEYALKLVRDRTSQDHFILTREALGDLDAYLNQVIQEHYYPDDPVSGVAYRHDRSFQIILRRRGTRRCAALSRPPGPRPALPFTAILRGQKAGGGLERHQAVQPQMRPLLCQGHRGPGAR